MTTTRDRLRALHAETVRQHVHFEKRKWNRESARKAVNVTIALLGLTTAGSGAAGMPAAATALAIGLLLTVTLNLALTDTQHDRDLHRLNEAWRRHRTDAARLLARDGVQRAADTAEKIERESLELECRIAETRSESLLHSLVSELPATPAGEQDPPARDPANKNA